MKSNKSATSSKLSSLCVLAIALVVCAASANAQSNAYVVTINQQFGVVDLETGAFHAIGSATPEAQSNLVWGPKGKLYSLTVSGNLDTINPRTGETHVVGATGLGYNALDLAGVRGKLYATDFNGNLYGVDSQSGLATWIGQTVIPADPTIPFTFNPDGTLNLCDETLYGADGKLYATFDSFTLDPNTLKMTTVISSALYEIDPATGRTKTIAPTKMNLGASLEQDGRFWAFHLTPLGFGPFGPIVQSDLERFDLGNGKTKFRVHVDPDAGAIFGAAPVRESDDKDEQ